MVTTLPNGRDKNRYKSSVSKSSNTIHLTKFWVLYMCHYATILYFQIILPLRKLYRTYFGGNFFKQINYHWLINNFLFKWRQALGNLACMILLNAFLFLICLFVKVIPGKSTNQLIVDNRIDYQSSLKKKNKRYKLFKFLLVRQASYFFPLVHYPLEFGYFLIC